MKKITILIPCYNEEASLPSLYEDLYCLMNTNSNYEWEVLMINDGSEDNTFKMIKELSMKDSRIYYINLSRNFGKENALLAGFDYASGDCMVIMDADLQHPSHVIPKMLQKWEEGYDDVYGKRLSRGKESWIRKHLSMAFYNLLQKTARYDILPNVGDFRLLDRKCIDELKKLRESERYTKGMYAWIGFRKASIDFETQGRIAGESSMSYSALIKLAINGITSFTVAPLKWVTYIGILVSIGAFAFMCYILFCTLVWGNPVAGYPTMMAVILFIGGVQMLSLGIIGEYLAKIFKESKRRPIYVIQEKNVE